MVNKANMLLWVKEGLLSGEFPQCRKRLATRDSKGNIAFCCLGVACEIAMRHGVQLDVGWRSFSGYQACRYDHVSGFLPDRVAQWLGLDDEHDPVVEPGGSTAVQVNDNLKWDFPTIARALVEYYRLEEGDDAAGAD